MPKKQILKNLSKNLSKKGRQLLNTGFKYIFNKKKKLSEKRKQMLNLNIELKNETNKEKKKELKNILVKMSIPTGVFHIKKKSNCNILLAKFNYDEKKKIHYLKYEYYDKKIEDYKEDSYSYMNDLLEELKKF